MMRKMVVLGVALVLSFVFLSVSEAVNLQKAIIGKWVEVKKDGRYGEQVEFLKDGTVIVGSVVGDYKFIDDNRLRLDVKGIFGSGAMVLEVSIDKQGQLLLIDPAGGITRHIVNTKVEREKWEKREVEREKKEELARAEREKKEAAERAEWEKRMKEIFTFSDLTILHKETKLMWTKDANIAGKEMTWDNAFKFVESLNEQKYGGYSDWRLPTGEELLTLVNFAKGMGYTEKINEVFNKVGFKNVKASYYWSSNTHASNSSAAWHVGFNYGNVTNSSKSNDFYVICVRSGQ